MSKRIFLFPLDNLHSDITNLVFDEKVSMRVLESDEIELLIKRNQQIPSFLRSSSISNYCLEEKADNMREAITMAYHPISALRLYKRGYVGISSFIVPQDMPDVVAPLPPLTFLNTHCGSPVYFLDKREITDIKRFYEMYYELSRDLRDQRLGLALRRFNMSFSAPNLEDKLINYIIALEALFLPGESEKAFRLKVYMITFLGEGLPERKKEIWDYIDLAYKLRSGIIHGNKTLPQKISLKKLNIKVSAGDFVLTIEDYTRASIRKCIEIKTKNRGLILPETIQKALCDPNEKAKLEVLPFHKMKKKE